MILLKFNLTLLDYIIIFFIFVSGGCSLKHGFIKEMLFLLTWIIIGSIAWLFSKNSEKYLMNYFYLINYFPQRSIRIIATYIIIFILTIVSVKIIHYGIQTLLMYKPEILSIDSFLGILFGIMRAILLISILLSFINSFFYLNKYFLWKNSVLLPYCLLLAEFIKNICLKFKV